jgi:hypothetical protein
MSRRLVRRAVAGVFACLVANGSYAFSQVSDSASFGNFYGAAAGSHVVDVIVGTAGEYSLSSGGSCATAEGTVTLPTGWSNITGHATNEVPISFQPKLVNGTFSGTCTGTYRNSSSNGPSTLTLSISYSGDNMVPTATAGVKYQILSILYDPPGNASSNGFSNSVSAGSTTSVAQNFSSSDSITFSAGFLGQNNSTTFSTSQSTGNSTSYTTSYQAASGTQLSSVVQAINHTQDQVYLLIDPSITVTQTGSASGYYSFGGSLDATGFGTGTVPPDIINVNIAGLQNPSSIPLEILEPQVPSPGVTLPGLSFICAHPLPASQCTQQNACGCTAADFAPIVAQDELATDTSQTTAPSSVDSKRYFYINAISLQGPDQQGAGPVKTTYSLSDSIVNSTTTSNGTSYGVSYSHSFGSDTVGPFTLGLSTSTSFTDSQTQTVGESNGTAHTGTTTMGTSDVGCFEYVDVYEDTTYHTFAFSLPQAPPSNCQ